MPSPSKAGKAALLTTLILSTGSCLNPRQDPSQFYVLTSLAESADAPARATEAGLVIGLGPVSFPSYLNRPQMVTRVSDVQVSLSESERWAESLPVNFATALARNLEIQIRVREVVAYPWLATAGVVYGVEVSVHRFERDVSGGAELRCRWSVADADGTIVASREAAYRQVAADATTDASVAALSRTIDELSADIAAAIREQRGN